MLLSKIRKYIKDLKFHISVYDILNGNSSNDIEQLAIYKQTTLDLIHNLEDYLKEQKFISLYNVNQLFFKNIDYGHCINIEWFDREYFTALTKSVRNLKEEDYEKFVDLISFICVNTLNAEYNYEFVKIIKDNLDEAEIDNICNACSNRVRSINETVSNAFAVRLKDEEPILEIDKDNLLKFKTNAIELLDQIGEGCVDFGTSKLKNIFEVADVNKLKMLYTYYEKYRLDRLEYFTNVNPNKNLQEYYAKNIVNFPEIIIPGSDFGNVFTQDFNSVLGRMFTQRELCSDKFSSKEIDCYKKTIAFMKNFIIYLRKELYYSYTSHCINCGEPIRSKSVENIKNEIINLPSTLNNNQTEFVMPDTEVERLSKQFKTLECYFKKDDVEYCIYKGEYSDKFVKEIKETHSTKFNTTQKEIMLYYLPFGRVDMALQIARLDISKDNEMIHKPKGSQGAKIVSKYHLHIYSENDQMFLNVDTKGKSKKPAGYEIRSILSDVFDESVAIKYFNEEFHVSDPNKDFIDIYTI